MVALILVEIWLNDYESTEGLITETKTINSNISLDNIYNAIRYLKPEQQGIILSTYKILEIYDIFANNEEYEKYISNLSAIAHEYTNRALALRLLHTAAVLQSRKQESNVVESMSQAYDSLLEEDKKKFCEELLQKKDFFADVYEMFIKYFDVAVNAQNENNINQEEL